VPALPVIVLRGQLPRRLTPAGLFRHRHEARDEGAALCIKRTKISESLIDLFC